MNVPLLDLQRQYGPLKEAVMGSFERIFDSGGFILGEDVTKLESEIAEYLGVKHAIGLTSGTDALWLSLKALGVGPGDKVLTSPFTFFATVSAICNIGAEPVFVDIDPQNFNIDPEKILQAIKRDTSRKIKAIIPVHVFGQAANLDPILSIARDHGIPVIEDSAQAIGTTYGGKRVGGLGAFNCFSFFPTKNLGALGDAGMVTTDDSALAERAKLIRTHGSKTRYYHDIIGSNFRIDTIQAAFLRLFLPHLEEWIKSRQETADFYDSQLKAVAEVVSPPGRVSWGNHTFHQYTVSVKGGRRDELQNHLKAAGIASCVYYPIPCHLQAAIKHLGFEKGMFPHTEKAADEVLSLPVFPGITDDQRQHVASTIVAWARK